MSKLRIWRRFMSGAVPLLSSVACGGADQSSASRGPGSGGMSAGTGGSSGVWGGAATGAVGTAWFEVIEPFPAVVESGTDPASVMNETVVLGASLDGSVLVGGSWMLVIQGNVQQSNAGFSWTRETGVTDLGHPGAAPPDPLHIFPQKVSRDASVVVGTSGPGLGVPIFHWTQASGMVDIGSLGGATAITLGDMSADGAVIVGTSNGVAFRWTKETGIVALEMPAGAEQSSALAVSGDGRVIFGTSSTSTDRTVCRWTAERGVETVDAPCGPAPGGVSYDGSSIAGLCVTGEGALPYQWSEAGGLRSLGNPPAGYTAQVRFASAEHGVLVAQGQGGGREDYQALRATEEAGFVALGALPGNPTCQALGGSFDSFFTPRPPMNEDGSVVAGNCIKTDAGTALGFRWTEAAGLTAMKPLGGHTRTNVTSVSADGILGGTSSGDTGDPEGVLWDENGEPRSLRALLEASGVALDGFTIDDVVVIPGGRLVYGAGRDATGAGRAWAAMIP
jgi:uncharacterized membrane protein